MKAIVNGTVYTPWERIDDGVVIVDGGSIRAVGKRVDTRVPDEAGVVDALGQAIVPGLIDIHTYGNLGVSITAPEHVADELPAFARNVARFGVTGFLISPTMGDRAFIARTLAAIGQTIPMVLQARAGAQPIGIHLEGPWLDPEQHGAFQVETLHAPSIAEAGEYVEAANGYLRIVTLAPNLPNAIETAQWLQRNGVLASLGHSNMNYEEAHTALASGAFPLVTHVYNAMTGLHHRKPGVLGAVLESEQVSGMLICDGVHAHPAAVRVLFRALGTEHVILVTDAIPGGGMAGGTFTMLNRTVEVIDGVARLPDGTIAGSILTMNRAVMNAVKFGALSLNRALTMATVNPARMLGLANKGRLAVGADADVALMDQAGNVSLTMVQGHVVFQA
jgi:N-acetylglucosamine-6-phosphate deacetylase